MLAARQGHASVVKLLLASCASTVDNADEVKLLSAISLMLLLLLLKDAIIILFRIVLFD